MPSSRNETTGPVISPPPIHRQLAFHQLLVAARTNWLDAGLRAALKSVDPKALKAQLAIFAPSDAQQLLAAAGIRDEFIFPTPVVLEEKPTLVGYYRLLTGISQKSFYGSGTGMSLFRPMEVRGVLQDRVRQALPAFCQAMSISLAELVRQLTPTITAQDVRELPLLTLGSQFQGANNNTIGQQATVDLFLVVADVVADYVETHDERRLVIRNASGRQVILALASDPDVGITEEFAKGFRRKVAIEIKGGTDASNALNRAGEAEKSHLKARAEGYRDCWTVIAKKGADFAKLKSASPSTTSWFDVSHLLARAGEDWDEFRSRLSEVVGIPIAPG